MPAIKWGDSAGPGAAAARRARVAAWSGTVRLVEPWFAPFALVNGAAVGLTPILLPVVASRYGIGHVGLVMGAFNLGALAAPAVGSLADRYLAHRLLAVTCAAAAAVSLWLFPLAGPDWQLLLALADGGGFAGAVTIANLLIVERRPKSEWNPRFGSLEAILSVGQGCALLLASWLAGLSARDGLLFGALVPAAAIPLALALIPRARGAPVGQPAPEGGHPPASAGQDLASAGEHLNSAGHDLAAAGQRLASAGYDLATAGRHHLATAGRTGEWGPASPSRAHYLAHRRPFSGVPGLLGGGFGWLLAAWIPAYAGTAILFALYPVLFQHAYGIGPGSSALAFAVIVFVSLPLFAAAGRTCQRRGAAGAMAGALGARVILLAALAAFAAVGHLPAVLPLAAFAGIMFAWSFLSIATPELTAQLMPNAQGDAQGLLNGSSGAAGLVGSVVGGVAASHWGYPAALAIGAGSVAVGLAVFSATTMRGRGAQASS
jgi:MFS transporter, DHA1 family, tetracycline resistance protein